MKKFSSCGVRVVNVSKEQKGQVLVVRLSGSIEENADFDQMIGAPPIEINVYSKEVSRINSVGVKNWIKYFQNLKAKGTRIKFFECSTAIVEQINMISNFTSGGSVESIYVPFSCTNCRSELVGLFSTAALRQSNISIPELKCTKCGGAAVFDDIEEEYFGFLRR